MRRFAFVSIGTLAALGGMLCLPVPVHAQDATVSSFHVHTSVRGVRFKVDGLAYTDQATFLWPRNSRHILEFPVAADGYQYNDSRTSRYSFGGWTESTSLLTPSNSLIQTVTADPGISGMVLNVVPEHQIYLNFFDTGTGALESAPTCGAPGPANPNQLRTGVVYVNGTCYSSSGVLWLPEGTHQIGAFPYPGFVFLGWKADINGSSAYLREFTFRVQGALTLVPRFSPAKRVRFRTDPPGLKVLVDRTEVPTTDIEPCIPNNYVGSIPVPAGIEPLCVGEYDFELGSTHVIGAPTPQVDRYGLTWVFAGFADGRENHSAYVTGPTVYPSDTVRAKFVRGVSASFITQPSGLKLKINGRDNWGTTSFVYAPGTVQQLEAPLEQTDARGRRYRFKKWNDNGAAAHEVTIPDDPTSTLRVIAEYELLGQLIVNTSQLGPEIQVDGTACAIPCKIDRAEGTEVRLAAPEFTALSDVHRLEYISWSDGAARERTAKVTGAEPTTLTVNYRTAYKLTTALDPPGAAALVFDPASNDGYFPADAVLTVTVQPEGGFRFRRWDGDLIGTSRISTLAMTKPRTIIARFDRVPFIAPAGIRNAAGQTPEDIVAPGSLFSVFGANLAPAYEVGPSTPLAQTLAGVSLVVANRILPLLFVSPEQINAQLARDLAPGSYKLQILRVGQPSIEGNFTVADSAPGLFSTVVDGQAFALAHHEDGTPITPASPARKGERITFFGTGFGLYKVSLPEGFAVPESVAFELAGTVEINAGDLALPSEWAGAASGMVGMDIVRFRIPDELPSQPGVPFKVRMNGHESNTVLLPIE